MKSGKSFLEYIKGLETKEGGFSIGQLVPASIDDTYFAIMSLTILAKYSIDAQRYYNYLKRSKKFLRYLKNYIMSPNSKIKLAYRYAVLCKLFRVAVPFYAYDDKDDITSIEELYYLKLIKQLTSNELSSEETISELQSETEEDNLDKTRFSTFASDPIQGRHIHTIYQAGYLFYRHWIKDEGKRSAFHNWFKSCQNPDGGYGFYPKTTSYMDNCYWAYKAYKVFGISPTYPNKLLDFIMSCRTKTGGLGRRNGTVPSHEYTYYGLCWLEILAKDLLLDRTFQ